MISACHLAAYLSGITLAVILCGAVAAGVFRTVTQIDDQAIALAAKLFAFVIFLYFGWNFFSYQILDFTTRVWSGSDFYF